MSLIDYIDKGGLVAYILLILNIVGFSIMFWKLFMFRKFKPEGKTTFEEIINAAREMKSIHKNEAPIIEILKNHVHEKIEKLESGLNTVRIIAAVSPLLGLLGTVMGILGSFENMAMNGSSDPAIFADDISLALITTIGGLIVAVPHYIGYNYFISSLYNIESRMEKTAVQNFYELKI